LVLGTGKQKTHFLTCGRRHAFTCNHPRCFRRAWGQNGFPATGSPVPGPGEVSFGEVKPGASILLKHAVSREAKFTLDPLFADRGELGACRGFHCFLREFKKDAYTAITGAY